MMNCRTTPKPNSILFHVSYFVAIFFATSVFGGMVSIPSAACTVQQSHVIRSIPFIKKRPDFGGEACLAMRLQQLGFHADQDAVYDAAGLDPLTARGCVTKELNDAAKQIGFQTGDVWFDVTKDDGLLKVWKQILNDLEKETPSIVCTVQNRMEQFVLIIGYDGDKDLVFLHDPAKPDGSFQRVDRTELLRSCQLDRTVVGGPSQKLMVCLQTHAESGNIKIDSASETFTNADFAQHIRKLKSRLPSDEFKIVVQKPFVVVGDQSLENVKRSATGTVKWAVDMIKKDYFENDPHHIIDIWLFKDKASYEKHNLELFNSKPSTPYGYYSPTNRVLVMNIATGGGTLVHEIVHPFMESNFEKCPSWFNEGLASLYEQSASRNNRIVGLTNWRLRGLQLAIKDGRVPTFKELCSTTTREFYDGHGTNYAQARYLCYYLQESGLLKSYYHNFRKNADDDPTGYKTLQQVLGRTDIDNFQEEWEAYVSKLRFGN